MTPRFPVRVLSVLCALLTSAAQAAPTMPSSGKGSTLYYHLGGSDAASRAPNPNASSFKLNLSGVARMNYSCGKFDAQLSLQNTLNQFSNLGPTLTNAVRSGIAALPMYILQRAQPGLYELIQTYIQRAKDLVNLSFESCEQMEREALDGKNPYDKYVTLAMGERWKQEANSGSGDVVQTKQNVQTNGGRTGFSWIFGSNAAGENQPPAKIINDTVTAAYNLTMSHATTSPPTTSYAATGTRLAKAFATPSSASNFATDVIGDLEVSTCTEGGCPTKASKMGLGLERKLEDEIPIAQGQLATLLTSSVPNTTDLDAASSPGVLVTRDLIDAVRALPKPEQAIAAGRLAQEIAVARTIDRALLIRQMLMTAKTIPEAQPQHISGHLDSKIAEINRAIDDLLYEVRVRKEVVSSSASTLLEAYRGARSASTANATATPVEQRPFIDGRVQ